jgi:hypothetical protein
MTRHLQLVIGSQFQKVGGLLAPALHDSATLQGHLTSFNISECITVSSGQCQVQECIQSTVNLLKTRAAQDL